jgi:hypothetical protein
MSGFGFQLNTSLIRVYTVTPIPQHTVPFCAVPSYYDTTSTCKCALRLRIKNIN